MMMVTAFHKRWRRLSRQGDRLDRVWPSQPELCWYFAYGANMASQVLVERRGLQPLSGEAAVLPGFELSFSVPGMWPEPAFANIEPAPSRAVHGVLYRLETADLEILTAQESSRYRRSELWVEGGESGRVKAVTFASPHIHRGSLPSRRYLALLRRGAAEWDLPLEYREPVLERQRSLHVPVLSTLVDGLLAGSARLSRTGIRLELSLSRMLRRRARRR